MLVKGAIGRYELKQLQLIRKGNDRCMYGLDNLKNNVMCCLFGLMASIENAKTVLFSLAKTTAIDS